MGGGWHGDARVGVASTHIFPAALHLATPDLAAPDLTGPDLTAPDLTAPDLTALDLTPPDLTPPDLTAPALPPRIRRHPRRCRYGARCCPSMA